MLLLDTSFLVEFERELAAKKEGPASRFLRKNKGRAFAVSLISLGEFAEGYESPRDVEDFLSIFRVLQLSRAIACKTAALQSTLSQRLGENQGKRILIRSFFQA